MMGINGVADALTAPPPLHDDHDTNKQGGLSFGRASSPMAKGKGGYYNDDVDYNVRGGCSFSRALLPKAQVKGYDNYYDGQGDRSFSGASSPMAKRKGGCFNNKNDYYVRGCRSFGPPHQSLHGAAFNGLAPVIRRQMPAAIVTTIVATMDGGGSGIDGGG